MDLTALLAANPLTVALAAIVLLVLTIREALRLWRRGRSEADVPSEQQVSLSKAWFQRAEGHFKRSHAHANTLMAHGARLDRLEKDVAALEADAIARRERDEEDRERLIRLEVTLAGIADDVRALASRSRGQQGS